MYPSQTSLIPVTVALSRYAENFIVENGWLSFLMQKGGVYEYWYLGTTPYKFLTGPAVPVSEVLIKKIFPSLTFFDISIYLIVISLLLGSLGWGVLVFKIGKKKKVAVLVFLLLLILPWRYFVSLSLSETSAVLAKSILPWILLSFWQILVQNKTDKTNKTFRRKVIAALSLTVLLLTNTGVLPIFLVGITSLVLAKSYKNKKFKRAGDCFKIVLSPIVYSLLIATLWYSLSFWWTMVTNPSIGGVSGVRVILRVFEMFKSLVPIGLAIVVVYFSHKFKDRLSIFVSVWTFTFLFLSIFRFLADIDFWMDWSSWFWELEVGIGIIIATWLNGYIVKIKEKQFSNLTIQQLKRLLLLIIIITLPFYFAWRFHLALGNPRLIQETVPEGVGSLEKVEQLVGEETVFLSGSTVFWAGSTGSPLHQVRGGRDEVSVDPSWRRAAYVIRESNDEQGTKKWLDRLEIKYVLVHTQTSEEYYHDFKHLNKWDSLGEVVWKENGDVLYQIF